jgi:arsenate reductase-like glutaredoxin family protein
MEENTNFEKLKKVLSSLGKGLETKKNTPDYFYLNTNKRVKNKEMFFGAVQIRKSYVAYHLYPVYTNPELLDKIPDSLKKRMQGKSCFNFKKEITEEQLDGIIELTDRSFEQFVENGYIEN